MTTPGPTRRASGASWLAPLRDPFLLALFGTVLVASVFPASPAAVRTLSAAVPFAIAWLFFLYGVRLPTREALATLRSWRLQVAVLAATYGVFPALGVLTFLFAPLPRELAQGFLFLGLLPSTVQSSIAFTAIARGNVAGALCAASLSNLVGVVITPLLVGALLGGAVGFSFGAVRQVTVQLVLPFVLGQLSRRWLDAWLSRHRRLLTVTDRGTILFVVYVAFARGVNEGIWSLLAWPDLLLLGGIASALLVAMLGITTAAGRWLSFPRADRVVLLLCGSQKSLASGLPMATVLLPSAHLGLLILPLMIYQQIQLVVSSIVSQRLGARRPPDE